MVRQRRNCFDKFGGFNQPIDLGQHPINLVASLKTGNEFQEALPLVKKEEAEPRKMVSQPGAWE
ncbi:hypothetical protein [Nostoc sp. 'Peltigera malacea cyanobiont' DB3992]|uniref:hypothetical protein n=1 Tax=Nostoc sp. 'Peltigera malacea cyanobiont' DB3992 TaxID=1206980 RepID=UPI001180AD78|nr:hypothetical protein [Nostoc sp. 'Peltigera malacea cyanobiont' DB3992]